MIAHARLPILPHLTALRFIAALLVFMHHVEQFKHSLGFTNYWNTPFIGYCGQMGVVLFFVLSGFLIAAQLFYLSSSKHSFYLPLFFKKRAARIIPLYVLMLLIGLFIIPFCTTINFAPYTQLLAKQYPLLAALFIFMLPQVALLITAVPFIAHLWSIGSEIHFYLFIGLVFHLFSKPITAILLVFATACLLQGLLPYLAVQAYVAPATKLLRVMHIESFLIGSIAAYVFIFLPALHHYLLNRAVQLASLLALAIISSGYWGAMPSLLIALPIALLILNWASNKKQIIHLNYAWLNQLGNCSYSIYMFHPLIIYSTIKFLNNVQWYNSILVYIISFLATIILSYFSYTYFEKLFLKQAT